MKHIPTGQRLADRAWFALERARGIPIETDLRRYECAADRILGSGNPTAPIGTTRTFTSHAVSNERDDAPAYATDALISLYARVAAASRSTLGLDPYREQVMAALALHEGKLIQMQTGEGKTLAAVFAAIAAAREFGSVHVLTANDYLARRDAEWMKPVYQALGIGVASITQHSSDEERRAGYASSVTYLTAKQAGFDYLRDEIQYDRGALLQRTHSAAIVDEADFVLIDEARSPLVLATADDDPGVDPIAAHRIARGFEKDRHFALDKTGRRCGLTLEGWQKADAAYGVDPSDSDAAQLARASVHVALHAIHLLSRGEDYIVRDNRIELVDETTGRIAERRRWPHGIQRALEAKEGVTPHHEGRVRGSITIRDYVSLYHHLAGMTATAIPAAREFASVHGLATVVIPPHTRDLTVHLDDRVFGTRDAKTDAIVAEVQRVHATGRPILIGTRTVRESEELANSIRSKGVECRVLNATQDAEEATLVARAGERGAVTVATNMAGRGTDIALGRRKAPGALDGQEVAMARGEEQDYDAVADLGGLLVIGANRHESVRIDLQLRGRAGRQGDPGSTRFFVSLEDDLIRRFAIAELIPAQARQTTGEIVDRATVREIERAQSIIEEQHASMRRTLRDYTMLVERQRNSISAERRDALLTGIVPREVEEATAGALERWGKSGREEVGITIRARIWMAKIDELWADHLALAEDVQEGIHLQRLGHESPVLVFVRTMSDAFALARERAIEESIRRFANLSENPQAGIEPHAVVPAPATTWTYFTSDDPFPEFRVSLVSAANPAGAIVAAVMATIRILSVPFELWRRARKRVQSRKSR